MVDLKKIRMQYCSPIDNSVGMRGYCEDFTVELYPHKVKIIPLDKKSNFEPFEEPINVFDASDSVLEKTLLPFIDQGDGGSLLTENSLKKQNQIQVEQHHIGFMIYLSEMSYKDRERWLLHEYKRNPQERIKIKEQLKQYQMKHGH